jgi:hypothetical protein
MAHPGDRRKRCLSLRSRLSRPCAQSLATPAGHAPYPEPPTVCHGRSPTSSGVARAPAPWTIVGRRARARVRCATQSFLKAISGQKSTRVPQPARGAPPMQPVTRLGPGPATRLSGDRGSLLDGAVGPGEAELMARPQQLIEQGQTQEVGGHWPTNSPAFQRPLRNSTAPGRRKMTGRPARTWRNRFGCTPELEAQGARAQLNVCATGTTPGAKPGRPALAGVRSLLCRGDGGAGAGVEQLGVHFGGGPDQGALTVQVHVRDLVPEALRAPVASSCGVRRRGRAPRGPRV